MALPRAFAEVVVVELCDAGQAAENPIGQRPRSHTGASPGPAAFGPCAPHATKMDRRLLVHEEHSRSVGPVPAVPAARVSPLYAALADGSPSAAIPAARRLAGYGAASSARPGLPCALGSSGRRRESPQ